MRNKLLVLCLLVLALVISCESGDSGGSGSKLTIFVTDEFQQPLPFVTVSSDGESVTTDAQGKAELSGVKAVDGKYRIQAQTDGYFTNYLNLARVDGSSQTGTIILLEASLLGTIDAAAGGIVGPFGMRVHAPANAFTHADGSAYSGPVSVYGRYIDYDNPILPLAMPGGDFAAINANGEAGGMRTYGFTATEFRGTSGEKLVAGNSVRIAVALPARAAQLMNDEQQAWEYNPETGNWDTPTELEIQGAEVFLPVTSQYTNIDRFVQTGILEGTVKCPNGDPVKFVEIVIQSQYSRYVTHSNDRGRFRAEIEATNGSWTYTVTPEGGSPVIVTAVPANGTTQVELTVGNCVNTGPGEGSFSIGGSSYSGMCINVPATGSGCSGYDVTITNNSGQSLIIYNMPLASSGSFSITEAIETMGGCQLYILSNALGGASLASVNGTLVKTGVNSFTLSGLFIDLYTDQTYNVSASGSY